MNTVKYIVDAVIESNEGRKDFQELLSRIEVNGRNKAVELRNEIDYFFTRLKNRDDVSVFFYKEGDQPNLELNRKIVVK